MTTWFTRRKAVGAIGLASLAWAGHRAYGLAAPPDGPKDCGPVIAGKDMPGLPADDSLPWSLRGGTVNDVSCLSRTPVKGVVAVRTEQDVAAALAFARANGVKLSMAGALHSMGGHAFARDGIVLDMTSFNKVSVDAAARIMTVESGARWHDIQNVLHPRFAVKAMQSSDVFTVGGSISVNAHGMDHQVGAIERTLRRLRVMLADGSVVTASRTENTDLYRHVVGGYGLFGVILTAEIEIADNHIYRSERRLIDIADFPRIFAEEIAADPSIGLFYGHLSTAPASFLREMLLYTYHRQDVPDLALPPLAEVSSADLRRLIFNLSKQGALFSAAKWYAEKELEHRFESCTVSDIAARTGEACLVSRNEPMHDSVPYLFNNLKYETDILHEYFVPRDKLVTFVDRMRDLMAKDGILLLNASVRVVHQEDIALNYAPQEAFSVVLYVNQTVDEAGIDKMRGLTRDLVDLAHLQGGRFFLPYQRHYDILQLERAYPMIRDVFAAKRRFDPQGLFSNGFYEAFAPDLTPA
ncbi:FAD-binding oxidoreductase [Taklimakanibacter lacteus]|uniref:FAD-binding oxidoreductase n=1 Tax=Taklimakanibacter lacteus TaxID=2268456 RepID=UPI000E661189